MIRFNILILYCLTVIIIAKGYAQDVTGSCPQISNVTSSKKSTQFKFLSSLPHGTRGYSVELRFSRPIESLEANVSASILHTINRITDQHWILAISKLHSQQADVKAEFVADYNYKQNVQLLGIILNGNVLCGSGKSFVYTSKNLTFDGHKECKPFKEKRYEFETSIVMKEDFYSKRIGLAIDIFFDDDIEYFKEVTNMQPTMHSSRHVSMVNSGIITAREIPVEVGFLIGHMGRPTPNIAAIIMNDVAVCGFAPVLHVVDKENVNQNLFGFLLEDSLLLPLNIISACNMLVVIVTGIFTWKILLKNKVSNVEEEALYAVPNKRF